MPIVESHIVYSDDGWRQCAVIYFKLD